MASAVANKRVMERNLVAAALNLDIAALRLPIVAMDATLSLEVCDIGLGIIWQHYSMHAFNNITLVQDG